MAVYKTGMGTMRRGHWDACMGTWDVGTSRLDVVWDAGTCGMQGQVGWGRGR